MISFKKSNSFYSNTELDCARSPTYPFGPAVGGHQDLGSCFVLEVGGKFIDALLSFDLFVVSVSDDGLVLDAHTFNRLCHSFRSSFLAMFLSDPLLFELLNLGNTSVLHLLHQGNFLALVLVLDQFGLYFDFLLLVVRLGHLLDPLVKLGQCLLLPPFFRCQRGLTTIFVASR